jgi:hypothetical protein
LLLEWEGDVVKLLIVLERLNARAECILSLV